MFVDESGVDVRALYLDLTGQRVPMVEPQESRRSIKEDADLVSFVRPRRAGEIDLRSWLRSFRGVREGATFSLRDRAPFLSALVLMATDSIAGKLGLES